MKELDSELNKMWDEKQELDNPKELPEDDSFVPARLAKPFDPEKEELVVRVIL